MPANEESGNQADPATEYLRKSANAETRRNTLYWDVRFFARILGVETPKMIRRGVRWRYELLRGTLEPRDGPCRIAGCDHQSVMTLPTSDTYRDDRPVCRKHYLRVKAAIYAIFVVAAAVIAVTVYLLS